MLKVFTKMLRIIDLAIKHCHFEGDAWFYQEWSHSYIILGCPTPLKLVHCRKRCEGGGRGAKSV